MISDPDIPGRGRITNIKLLKSANAFGQHAWQDCKAHPTRTKSRLRLSAVAAEGCRRIRKPLAQPRDVWKRGKACVQRDKAQSRSIPERGWFAEQGPVQTILHVKQLALKDVYLLELADPKHQIGFTASKA